MKKLIFFTLILFSCLNIFGQTPWTLIEDSIVVKHLPTRDQVIPGTIGKYFVGYDEITTGNSIRYFSVNGRAANTGLIATSPLPMDSINTLAVPEKTIMLTKRGDEWGGTIIARDSLRYASYGIGAKPVINYVDYFGKANVVVKNIDLTYDGYYFVSNSGNDAYSGTEPDSAWATIAKVNSSDFEPGDNILFKTGDEWRGESLTVGWSGTEENPIVFGAYGTGAKPVFTGADTITGWTIRDFSIAENTSTEYSATLATTFTNGSYYNIRVVIADDSLSYNGDSIRIAILGHTSLGTNITGCSIGERSGTTEDFSATPTRITFNGGSSSINVGAAELKWSDRIYFPTNELKDYIVQFYGDTPDYMYGAPNGVAYRSTENVDNTLVNDVTMEGGLSGRILARVEVKRATKNVIAYRTPAPIKAISNDAYRTVVVIDGNRFMPVATLAELDADFEYFVEDSTGATGDSIYVYSITDPDTRVAELSTQLNGILDGNGEPLNSNIVIKDLEFRYYGYAGVRLQSVTNGTIGTYHYGNYLVDNCTFYHIREQGILMRDGFSRNVVQNCTVSYSGNGLYTSRGSHNNTFKNNTITNSFSYPITVGLTDGHGIGVYSSDSILVEGNYIQEPIKGGGGIQLDQADVIIRYNEIHVNTASAVGSNVVNAGDTVDVYYNLLIVDGGNGDALGTSTTNGKVNIYNNTIIHKTGTSSLHSIQIRYPDNITFKNNIVYNNSISTSSLVRMPYYTLETKPEMNYNLFYNENSTAYYVIDYGSGRTLAAWQSASGEDLNSVEGNPLFTTEFTNLQLQAGSPAINAGVNVGLTRDFAGNQIVGNPDMGAFEN